MAYVGELRIFAGGILPDGWKWCDGSSLSKNLYPSLYDVLGDAFGGDTLSFNVPDLRGRIPVGVGKGVGLSERLLGDDNYGEEGLVLSENEISGHIHNVSMLVLTRSGDGVTGVAENNNFASESRGNSVPDIYNNDVPDVLYDMSEDAVLVGDEERGGGEVHNNMQPSITLNYMIALIGK